MANPKPYLCKHCGETEPANFYPKYKGECKSCEKIRKKKYRDNWEKRQVGDRNNRQRAWRAADLLCYRTHTARHRARSKKIPFDLDLLYIEKLWDEQAASATTRGDRWTE